MSAYRRPFSRNALASDGASASASSRKKQTSLPSELCVKIHTDKVDVGRLKPWINDRITELLGVEDEVLIDMISVMLEESAVHKDGGHMLRQLESFLDVNARTFVVELWTHLASAQENAKTSETGKGVPSKFLRDVEAERARADAAYERMRSNRERYEQRGRAPKPYDKPRGRDGRGPRHDSREPRRRSRWEGERNGVSGDDAK